MDKEVRKLHQEEAMKGKRKKGRRKTNKQMEQGTKNPAKKLRNLEIKRQRSE